MLIDDFDFNKIMTDIKSLCKFNIVMKHEFMITKELLNIEYEEAVKIMEILEYTKMIRIQNDQPEGCQPKVYIL